MADLAGASADAPLLALRRLKGDRTEWMFVGDYRRHAMHGTSIRHCPGRGISIVAMKPFASGARVMSEEPLLTWTSAPGTKNELANLDALVGTLDAAHYADYHELVDIWSGDGKGKTAAGIWNSNSFVIEDALATGRAESIDGLHRAGVFRAISRLNHDCHPNAFISWNGLLGVQTVHALRDIAAGEELTIAYVAGAEAGSRTQRRRLLARKYRFVCKCATCRLEGAALIVSDRRHSRLAAIHRALSADTSEEAAGAVEGGVLALVEEQLDLMRAEGVPIILGKAGWILAIVRLQQAGDVPAAAAWAKTGVNAARHALGADSSAHQCFSNLLAAVTS